MLKTKISLKNFFIFNSTFCNHEAEVRECAGHWVEQLTTTVFFFDKDEKKILFFYPEAAVNEKLKDVGFIEALIKFTGSFSFDDTTANDVLTMKTSKTMKLFFEPEKDFWIVLVSSLK